MSKARMGCAAWNKGKTFSEESKIKMGKSQKKRFEKNKPVWTGRKITEEHRLKLSLAKKGKIPHNKGSGMDTETARLRHNELNRKYRLLAKKQTEIDPNVQPQNKGL